MRKEVKKEIKGSALHIEIDKLGNALCVSICEVRSVSELSDEIVVARLKRGSVRVVGSELVVSVYENRVVEIVGAVRGIELI